MLDRDPIIKDIPGVEGCQISENGEVYNKKTGQEIKHRYCHNNYVIVCFFGTHKLHRLLAKTFIPNPHNYPCVDHIDRNRSNYSLKNLRWVDYSQNSTNRSFNERNTSGITGLFKETYKSKSVWCGKIEKNKKKYTKRFEYNNEGFKSAAVWLSMMREELHTYI